MQRLIDLLTFKPRPDELLRDAARRNDRPRRDERDAAMLAGKYPADLADIESVSEYRLASLLQYPHY